MSTLPAYLQPLSVSVQPLSDAEAAGDIQITNNGFFPPIRLLDFVEEKKGKSAFSPAERLRVLRWAVQEVNDDLQDQYCIWSRRGYETLADIKQDYVDVVDGKELGVLVNAYHEAVFAYAAMILNKDYAGTAVTRYAEPRAGLMQEGASNEQLRYRQAIYRLTGKEGRAAFVELL